MNSQLIALGFPIHFVSSPSHKSLACLLLVSACSRRVYTYSHPMVMNFFFRFHATILYSLKFITLDEVSNGLKI